ncbi:hypothetical protein QJS04_geneDACA006403 [Acorus gramineus]|uniref:Uncharacterized protein n=1 Tax=Acorus gramineus TaxID=55184 RepID=A0AAV9AYF0_ACOGR|nr:hypothetical protein QJS04_geneDACA006403 [Acorus gramineus]
MTMIVLMFKSLVRLVTALVRRPAASVSTILYHSNLLPRDVNLQRLVAEDLLDAENYLFHFIITFMRCI